MNTLNTSTGFILVPDRWYLQQVTINGNKVFRILSGWVGGYTQGTSWRYSTPIASVSMVGVDLFVFETNSGTQYRCYRGLYGFTSMSSDINQQLMKVQEQAQQDNSELQLSIEGLTDPDQILEHFQSYTNGGEVSTENNR